MEAAKTLRCSLAAEVVKNFGRVRLRVEGTSMVPVICPGDLVVVERASVREMAPQEIAVFAREGRLIMHRVIARSGSPGCEYLITRGDRTRRDDAPVSGSELIGRVTRIGRRNGRLQSSSRPSVAQRLIGRVLRCSDRATYLYLYLTAI
jgi:signal peptidase I